MTWPVINCALTDGGSATDISPHVPITPEQIASEGLAARRASAAMVHIHVRNSATGEPARVGWPKTP